MPVDVVHKAIDVLQELPNEARLPDAGLPNQGDQPRLRFDSNGVEKIFEQPQLIGASDEGRLEGLGLATSGPLGEDSGGLPGRHRKGLPLEALRSDRFESDRSMRRLLGAVADQHGPRFGDRLEA